MVSGHQHGKDHLELLLYYSNNAYGLQNLNGVNMQRNINGKFLKFYYPTTWEIYANNIQSKYPEFWENMRALH